MKVIYGINKIRRFRKPVVALGVFDGVHRGHLRILKAAADKAKRIKGTSTVVTFFPHPQKEKSLYSLEHRLKLIRALGIGVCIVIKFTKAFSRISAEDFVKDVLADKIGARYVYVGRNFRFGRQAQGGFRILNKLSHLYNFKLKVFDIIKINGHSVSSTYIRKLITEGKLSLAQKLLSRPVSILGTVIKGSSLAARLGFPTANIDPHHEVLPPSGIYAISAIFNDNKFKGACYIGARPTFSRQNGTPLFTPKGGIPPRREAGQSRGQIHIEAHIFNFHKNIYGEYLEIRFIKKIRDERKFRSAESLVRQISKDINLAKKISLRHTF